MIIILLGPTASGKSAVALELAKKIGGEIVNADSRQIYQYLNVATAKPSQEERKEVPHHLYDFLNPKKNYSAGEYAKDAAKIISEIFARNHTPILVGGTGFYLRALFDGLPELPRGNKTLRKKLLKIANEKGREYLHKQLQKVDPVSAERIPYQNLQRVIRALEVYHLTKRPISSFCMPTSSKVKSLDSHLHGNDFCLSFGLKWEREALKERIRRRIEKMLPLLIQETKELLKKGFSSQDPGMQSVGYRETIQYLEGKISDEVLFQQLLQRTFQYAKRQMTWFRADARICWLELKEPFRPERIAQQIKKSLFSPPL